MVVQMAVDGGGHHRNIGMVLGEPLDALRRGQQAHKTDVLRTTVLEALDSRRHRVRGRKHWIENDHQPVRQVLWRFEIVLDGLKRFRVTVEPDMGDASCRYQVKHTFQQTITRPEDGRKNQFLARKAGRFHRFERRLDLHLFGQEVTRRLVAQ